MAKQEQQVKFNPRIERALRAAAEARAAEDERRAVRTAKKESIGKRIVRTGRQLRYGPEYTRVMQDRQRKKKQLEEERKKKQEQKTAAAALLVEYARRSKQPKTK